MILDGMHYEQSPSVQASSSSEQIRTKNIVVNQPLIDGKELKFEVTVEEDAYELAATLASMFVNEYHLQGEPERQGHGEIATRLDFLSSFLAFMNGLANTEKFEVQGILALTRGLLKYADNTVLAGNNVHVIVAHLPVSRTDKRTILKNFVKAEYMIERSERFQTSNLVRTSFNGQSKVYAVFGGQGNSDDYFTEMIELYDVYEPVVREFIHSASALLKLLTTKIEVLEYYPGGMNLISWLERHGDGNIPSKPYFLSPAVSFPLITLLQLLHFKVSCEHSGCNFKDVPQFLAGATGHSQGILAAAAIAAMDSAASFLEQSLQAITVSVSLGVRIQQLYGLQILPRSVTKDHLFEERGMLTPMLSVRGLSMEVLQNTINNLNNTLPSTKVKMEISLQNSDSNLVVTGDPLSLRGLCACLDRKFPQSSIPAQKALGSGEVVYRFLPAAAPYHNSYLTLASSLAVEDSQGIMLRGNDLKLPLFSTMDGSDLREHGETNIIPELIRMVCCEAVNWPAALKMPNATHIIDFGPGGTQGVGLLANSLKSGQEVTVILSTLLDGPNSEIRYKSDVLDRSREGYDRLLNHQPWSCSFQPTLARWKGSSQVLVNTRFTRLFLLPPIMVAAMTPTTSCWELVAEVMNAGYHIELACGGFHDSASLSTAIVSITNNVSPVKGITCNVIYSNPKNLRWQIDSLQSLVQAGYPINGLTIGAGVPSLEIVQTYVARLQLQHIGFKPSSIVTIEKTLRIAEGLQPLPVILQWTGGRGGGHHSNEDFHMPLKVMYRRIRAQHNVILVVGSGFGGSSDTIPYITGTWATDRGLPSMPVDGILLGSRVMVAKEARTSSAVKALIVATDGVGDHEWHGTSSRVTGGILSVISEMRQPVHIIATRAVMLWDEFDKTIFCLSAKVRAVEIARRRDEIITKLNRDYHRVWFGCTGQYQHIAELDEMTYSEVLYRFVELTYVKDECRWAHESWRKLFFDLLNRTKSRLDRSGSSAKLDDLADPYRSLASTLGRVSDAVSQVISYDDSIYFLRLFRHGGHKPVPFIPVLDEDFESWFKKDSLWQSEDIAAVPEHDAGRVCVLQGPVAAQYSTQVDESVSNILGEIHCSWVNTIMKSQCYSASDNIPFLEHSPFVGTQFATFENYTQAPECPSNTTVHSLEHWIINVRGSRDKGLAWAKALLNHSRVLYNRRLVQNPFLAMLSGLSGMDMLVWDKSSNGEVTGFAFLQRLQDNSLRNELEVRLELSGEIVIEITHHQTVQDVPVIVACHFSYEPGLPSLASISMDSDQTANMRNFFHHVWFGPTQEHVTNSIHDQFECGPYIVTTDAVLKYQKCITTSLSMAEGYSDTLRLPLDFAVIIAWKALLKPLFSCEFAADILTLLHMSNDVTLLPGHDLPAVGDSLHTKAIVTEVAAHSSGTTVEVRAQIFRSRMCILEVKTRFLLAGNQDHQNLFFRKSSMPISHLLLKDEKMVTDLLTLPWFQPLPSVFDLLGKLVVFELQHFLRLDGRGGALNHEISGDVKSDGTIVGRCYLSTSDDTQINIIHSFLGRYSDSPSQPRPLQMPLDILKEEGLSLTAPTREQSIAYSAASGDFNPIHVAPVFARLAGLPTPIVHGMHLSAEVLKVTYTWLCDGTASRLRKSHVQFVGKVFAGDQLRLCFTHVAMHKGLKVVEVKVRKTASDEVVLIGTYEIEEPLTAMVFTGQGSQRKGMGMDLYSKSVAARKIWDTADDYFQHEYGFRITEIVRDNPQSLTVYFGGIGGRHIRANYMALTADRIEPDGRATQMRLFPDIDEHTMRYVYVSESGLLSSTQFTQPAIVLMELAIMADLEARQLLPRNAVFAGHSLGEYSALVALGHIMSLETVISTVFYRGLVMQSAVTYDDHGRSQYAMGAVDPTRVNKGFDGHKLELLVAQIASKGQWLIEVVNRNIVDSQYVCAGETLALHCLGVLLDRIHDASEPYPDLTSLKLIDAITQSVEISKLLPASMELKRSKALIPLKGLNVPFHSSYLSTGVESFRKFLLRSITIDDIDHTKLVGLYVPNLTGKPFQVTREYFEEILRLTGSVLIKQALETWVDSI
ncbi:hypothetical protein FAVG1_08648 [Fusarium avenaceum]|nr:hypothetical protein FAVG1_08648 [Fusarium avenaceum]